MFYNLRTSLGVQANNLHALDIKGCEHRNNKFVVGFDNEKCWDWPLKECILKRV